MPPPNSMRATSGAASKSGNRSPPRQVAKSPNQAPGAMRGWEPNTEMAATAQRTPPTGMATAKDRQHLDMGRVTPPAPVSNRKVPHGFASKG